MRQHPRPWPTPPRGADIWRRVHARSMTATVTSGAVGCAACTTDASAVRAAFTWQRSQLPPSSSGRRLIRTARSPPIDLISVPAGYGQLMSWPTGMDSSATGRPEPPSRCLRIGTPTNWPTCRSRMACTSTTCAATGAAFVAVIWTQLRRRRITAELVRFGSPRRRAARTIIRMPARICMWRRMARGSAGSAVMHGSAPSRSAPEPGREVDSLG